jgi:hypothetical protein
VEVVGVGCDGNLANLIQEPCAWRKTCIDSNLEVTAVALLLVPSALSWKLEPASSSIIR